ncbi:helix-turn-helix transcriptional regulator, partial [Paenibacillus sp.]|uniref:helix-turn-helix transcriptional regulator n=1 Tax=Paenibacillus sp. TaxID=58172 RepID=UPI002D5B8FB1
AQAKLVVIELFVQLARIARELGASRDRLFDPAFGDYESVMRVKTIEELRRLAERKCEAVLDALGSLQEVRPNKVIEELKRIVQERYMDNVSLRGVAQEIYMNPNYLGKLFKSNAGMSFNDYLLQVRMEKAKELLLHSDMKVYEISQAVGYGELDWFYKRFKAYTGISASEYRGGR